MRHLFTPSIKNRILFVGLLCFIAQPAYEQPLLNPHSQPQFVNQLPVPDVIDGRNGGTFTIGITEFNQWLGLINPVTGQPMQTKVWGYDGSYPGPYSADVMVNMYDSKGSRVKSIQNKAMSKGEQVISVEVTELVNGIYFCEIIINQQRILLKMILQK